MNDLRLSPPAPETPLKLSPTDISQFVRLDQCERYLRLRLYERAAGSGFMREYGVAPQAIPPLLTRSGRLFEERIEGGIRQRHRVLDFSGTDGAPHNAQVAEAARTLANGEVLFLFQPRLHVELDGWALSGVADVVRLERGADGALDVLVADLKSSTTAKVEHRLQVAFYHAMLAELLRQAGLTASVRTGILYAGPPPVSDVSPAKAGMLTEEVHARQMADAARLFAAEEAWLELVDDPEAYLEAVRDLVTGPESLARRVAAADFQVLPFHLTYKCDGCLYNEFCLKRSAETDDLSLIPHLSAPEKAALRRLGITTVSELARLKDLVPAGSRTELQPAEGNEDLCRRAATTWPVGPRLDELIHRARRYRRWRKDAIEALSYLPGTGYGTLPYSGPDHNPNLVRIYIDAQHDYLEDRLYLIGALVVAGADGEPVARRSIVHLTDGPPGTAEAERELLARWATETLRAVVELARPDETGEPVAPLHLVFFNSWEQRLLLEALSRHLTAILEAAPALYDFMTQVAAFDSPVASFLDQEIREGKNYPMVCQSLQAVAALLRFDWDQPQPFTQLFRARLFDHWRKLERPAAESEWFTGRARFNSQIPLEFAYAAWNALEPAPESGKDDYAAYRTSTPELLTAFQARRLEALEHIARDFPGNRQTRKTAFRLPDLAEFTDRAESLAQALDEFVTIERHVELGEWKTTRHAPPERRVLMGETLLVRYLEADQGEETLERLREQARRRALRAEYEAAALAENPDAEGRPELSAEQKKDTRLDYEGVKLRLRLAPDGLDCSLEEALALCTLREGDRLVLNPRWTVDERLPPAERTPFTPTPKQCLYGPRVGLDRLYLERDAEGRVTGGWAEVTYASRGGGGDMGGFAFGARAWAPEDGQVCTLDTSPDNYYGYWCRKVARGLCELEPGQPGRSVLYEWLRSRSLRRAGGQSSMSGVLRAEGQERFLAGLDALRAAGAMHDFEPGKREYIGAHGDTPVLLVQGPPGTGKSFSTAFAVLARLQGALEAGVELRVFLSYKTHAATDVLLEKVREVQEQLRECSRTHPETYRRYFHAALVDVPLYRLQPRGECVDGIRPLPKDNKNLAALKRLSHCVVGATPGGIYNLFPSKDRMFQESFCGCLVLDEASQMSLPEALMAALPLAPDGQVIVVGDHRQMPPIVQHDWEGEPRRTFREYQAYQSLFLFLLSLDPPVIRFAESFRLHAAVAEFLRREIYAQDGIDYHSNRREVLPDVPVEDPFVRAVLSPEHPLVVVVHAEAESQTRNPFEQELLRPVLETLADPELYGLDADEGLGVVVPHRAQRAALQLAVPALNVTDPATGTVLRSAVDTVERFQGGERTAILVGATESDREYLVQAGEFLLDPRRLTVAVSRAKRKLVLVASESVFSLFSADEETFRNGLLWKNLLRRTCTELLWEGEQGGERVQVWGCARHPAAPPAHPL